MQYIGFSTELWVPTKLALRSDIFDEGLQNTDSPIQGSRVECWSKYETAYLNDKVYILRHIKSRADAADIADDLTYLSIGDP